MFFPRYTQPRYPKYCPKISSSGELQQTRASYEQQGGMLVKHFYRCCTKLGDEQYNRDRWQILQGPDQSYKFHLSILGTNRQIRKEAFAIFQRMNSFISLTHDHIGEELSWGIGPHNPKVSLLARGERACGFPGISMSIDFQVGYQDGVLRKNKPDSRAVSVFLVEDLLAACASIQGEVDHAGAGAGAASICISVSEHIGAVSTLLKNEYPTPGSRLSIFLTALGRLCGFKNVEIHGPVSSPYKSALIAAMCDQPLNVVETMESIGAQIDQGDEASKENHWDSAILAYGMALNTIRGSSFRLDRSANAVLIGGRFHGQQARRYVLRSETLISPSCQQQHMSLPS